ncbi:MAG TPA: hypothetical protein VKT70_08400, partial [Stellaceae bacterium]|nr:hypothetical protein [Stellaceae bacterium]
LGGAEGTIEAGLAAMAALDLVHRDEPSGDYLFKHALVRDALYQSLLSGPRAALHLRIAEEVERRNGNRLAEVAEVLALHYGQSTQTDKAFTYLVMAGSKSAGLYSLDEAERYFEQALELCESHEELLRKKTFLDLLAVMAALLFNKSKLDVLKRLVDRHGEHAQSLGDSPQWVSVLSTYSFGMALCSDLGLALAAATRALAMAERLNDDRAKAYARASFIYVKTIPGRLSREEADHHRALLLLERQRVSDPQLHVLAIVASAWDYLLRGHTNAARAQALELEAQGRRTGDPRALGASLWLLGWIAVIDARYDDAFTHGDECVRVALTPVDREIGRGAKVCAQIFRGEVREGIEELLALREQLIANGHRYVVDGLDPALGIAKILQGDFSGGIRFLAELVKQMEAIDNPLGAVTTRIYQAEAYIELLTPRQMPKLGILLRNLPFLVMTALTGRKKAMRLLSEARKCPTFTGDSYFVARIDTDLGILLKMGKKQAAAREHLERARPIAAHLKAAALLAKIDTALAELR